jgi:hypothetical protein
MQPRDIVIEPPVKGYWATYNPPGHPGLAFDFLAVDEYKSLYSKGNFLRHLVSSIPVEDTYTWSKPVFSPVDGVVVGCHDLEEDRLKISFACDLISLMRNKPHVTDGFGAFGGNHIFIQAGEYYVLLCHLKRDSIKVHIGESVKIGQLLAEVGNSGASIQPHLHVQVMSNDQYFPLFANLLPFKLSRGKIKKDKKWSTLENFQPANKMHYSFEE